MDWIHLAENWYLRLALMNVVMKFGLEVLTAVTMKYMRLCAMMLPLYHNPQSTLFTVMNDHIT